MFLFPFNGESNGKENGTSNGNYYNMDLEGLGFKAACKSERPQQPEPVVSWGVPLKGLWIERLYRDKGNENGTYDLGFRV